MLKYVARRLLFGAITVFFIATATFVAMHIVPGDPISGVKAMQPEIRANLEAKYGLDQPVFVQYLKYIGNLAHGDFGISFTQQNRSVNDIIRDHFPISAQLGVLALLIATLTGILLGSLAALKRGAMTDRWTMFFVILGVSVPNFVFAAISQWGLTELNKAAGTTVLPVAGWGSFAHMIVPAVVLGLASMAFLTRLMRSSLLEIVHQDYIRTAKAKGVPPPIAQCGAPSGHLPWTYDCNAYHRWLRGRNRLCDSRTRALRRSSVSTIGLYRHHGNYCFLRFLSGLDGGLSRHSLRVYRSTH